MMDGFLFLVGFSLKIAHKCFLDLIKIQTVNFVFGVYFYAEKSRYHFGGGVCMEPIFGVWG